MLQRIRDEAHRFAITYHRSKRSKMMLESLLDEISQLGEVRRKALLDHFGSVTALRKATTQELATVPGIGERSATLIYEQLQAINNTEPVINMETGEISN